MRIFLFPLCRHIASTANPVPPSSPSSFHGHFGSPCLLGLVSSPYGTVAVAHFSGTHAFGSNQCDSHSGYIAKSFTGCVRPPVIGH